MKREPLPDEVSPTLIAAWRWSRARVWKYQRKKPQVCRMKQVRRTRWCKGNLSVLHLAFIGRWAGETIAGIFHEWLSKETLPCCYYPTVCLTSCAFLVCACMRLDSEPKASKKRFGSLDNTFLWWSGVSSPLSAARKPTWRRRGGLRWVDTFKTCYTPDFTTFMGPGTF